METEVDTEGKEIRIYRVVAILQLMDDDYPYTEYSTILPLTNDSGKIIGSATLCIDGHVLYGTLLFDYATPERLSVETQEIPIYPHVRIGKDFKVDEVTISTQRPNGPFVPWLGKGELIVR